MDRGAFGSTVLMQPLWKREYTQLDLVKRAFCAKKEMRQTPTNKQTHKTDSCTSHQVKFPRF